MTNLNLYITMDRTLCVIFVFEILCVCTFVCHAIDSSNSACPDTSYGCHNSTKCIPVKYQCDGDSDCPLGDDEEQCDKKVSGCGDSAQQNGVNGSVSSMGYPSPYYNMAFCRWQIEVPRGWAMTLSFDDVFDIEKPRQAECVYDRVNVFQDDPLVKIGEYCGSHKPPPIHIDGNKAVVEFLTDRDNAGRGFRLTWTSQEIISSTPIVPLHKTSTILASIAPTTTTTTTPTTTTTTTTATTTPGMTSLCPFVINKGGMTGDIKSPTPPSSGGESHTTPTTCRWIISVKPGYLISLKFISIHLSKRFPPFACQDASLKIFDGKDEDAPLVDKLCGPFNPGQILSTANSMLLILTAPKGLGAGVGFHASYLAVPKPLTTTLGPPPAGCDGSPILITSSQGFITSPHFDGVNPYRNFLDCTWTFIGKPGDVFTFSFVDFKIEYSSDCRFDYVRIADTTNDINTNYNNISRAAADLLNTTFCSLKLPPDTETKTANVSVTFHSDDQVPGLGFNVTYRLGLPAVVCSDDQFKCGGDGECINGSLVCDSVDSCSDGSDEIICPNGNGTSCGKSEISDNHNDYRIVGGAEALPGAWPWTVSILSPEGTHLCGASLVLPNWAISAGHCFDQVYNGNYGSYSIMAGRHELRHSSRGEQRKYIDDVYIPDDYVSSTSRNDIAVIRLISPFVLSDTVGTVCLPEKKVESDRDGWITGWGETLDTCCADKLKQAMVPVLNDSLCKEYYGNRIYDHMMCAGFQQGGVDSCRGDSGGPFVVEREESGRWELQGVTSWGEQCGLPKTPGVYTAVHDFLRWIQQTMALHEH